MCIAMLSEYFLGEGVAGYTKYLSHALFVFPLLSIILNFRLISMDNFFYKSLISLVSGVVFFILGYLIVLALVKLRIILGLSI